MTATDAYIECAVWTGYQTDDAGEQIELDKLDFVIPTATYAVADQTVRAFIVANAGDLIGMDDAQIGHDLWLTRNHHGAGFWDRGLGKRGDRLTAAADSLGESYAYVGDDARLYFD